MDGQQSTLRFAHLLAPIRHCLHRFLDDFDAARLLRVNRSISLALLSGFTFTRHIFRPTSVSRLSALTALYQRYGLRIHLLSLPYHCDGPLHAPVADSSEVRSILPASLIALVMGEGDASRQSNSLFAHVGAVEQTGELRFNSPLPTPDAILHSPTSPFSLLSDLTSWRLEPFTAVNSTFDQPILAGDLPEGLLYLQLPHDYDCPLVEGSIPSTVRCLQLGYHYRQALGRSLPVSLTHLLLGFGNNEPFQLGELPASLQQLHLGSHNSALGVGVLPLTLKVLDMGERFDKPIEPGTIPSTVTHVRLSDMFNKPLLPSSIPEGVAFLNMGDYDQPIPPLLFPLSLRTLLLSRNFVQPLPPDRLNHGLQVVVFPVGYVRTLVQGVMPESVRCVDLESFDGELERRAIPEGVEWVRLPSRYAEVEHLLPPSALVEWTVDNH